MNKPKPAYCLRREDFKPFVGLRRHAERSALGAVIEERRTGEYCGPDSDYEMLAGGRGLVIGLYNLTLIAIPLVGGAVGLAKLLSK